MEILTKKELLAQGYGHGGFYIGLLTSMFLFCGNCMHYHWHTLFVKNTNDYKYVCDKCSECEDK